MNKGFTLIELILVIALLSLIALISVPVVTGIINDSKEKAYNEQVNTIINTARTYMTKNPEKLPEEDEFDSACVSILDIQKAGLLESKNISNPNFSPSCEEDLEKEKNKLLEDSLTESDIARINEEIQVKKNVCKNEYLNGVINVKWNVEKNKYVYSYDNSRSGC